MRKVTWCRGGRVTSCVCETKRKSTVTPNCVTIRQFERSFFTFLEHISPFIIDQNMFLLNETFSFIETFEKFGFMETLENTREM